jgi:uncharacterized Zn finger protein
MVTSGQVNTAKERALAQGVQVYMLELGKRYVALSSADDGLAYEITVQSRGPGDLTCTCPGAVHRGICKHIGSVMLRLEAGHPRVNEQDIQDLYR